MSNNSHSHISEMYLFKTTVFNTKPYLPVTWGRLAANLYSMSILGFNTGNPRTGNASGNRPFFGFGIPAQLGFGAGTGNNKIMSLETIYY